MICDHGPSSVEARLLIKLVPAERQLRVKMWGWIPTVHDALHTPRTRSLISLIPDDCGLFCLIYSDPDATMYNARRSIAVWSDRPLRPGHFKGNRRLPLSGSIPTKDHDSQEAA